MTDPAAVANGFEGTYDFVGIIMTKSAEGDAVAHSFAHDDNVEVIENASFWDVRAKGKLEIRYDDVSEYLGFEVDGYAIQHEMSTHYGRLITTDDSLMLFSDPIEAMEYLSR
jgi:MmoB/DmpM family.